MRERGWVRHLAVMMMMMINIQIHKYKAKDKYSGAPRPLGVLMIMMT